jgi:HK97 family phage major capsid protein
MATPANTDYIQRSNVEARIPEDVSSDVIQSLPEASAALALFPRVTLSSKVRRLPVLSLLPVAYWVDGDIGLKQTTRMAWDKKVIEAEEIAAIVPIPENVIDDEDFDVWAEVKPRLVEAIGAAVDEAIFFGVNSPASFPPDLLAGATAAGNTYELGTASQGDGGLAEDLNQLMALVEDEGFDVNGFVTHRGLKARLRGARDTTGQKLLDVSTDSIEGAPVKYAMSGLWPTDGSAEMFAGDFSQGILGIRRDITYKMLDQAVIQDGDGTIVYNLPQQDMVALRVTFRLGFQVANPITRQNPNTPNLDTGVPTAGQRYPFAVLTDETS